MAAQEMQRVAGSFPSWVSRIGSCAYHHFLSGCRRPSMQGVEEAVEGVAVVRGADTP